MRSSQKRVNRLRCPTLVFSLSLAGWLYVLSLDENNTRLKAYLCSTVSEFVYQTAVAGRRAGGRWRRRRRRRKGGERGPKEACAPHTLSMCCAARRRERVLLMHTHTLRA